MADGFHDERWVTTRKPHVCEMCGEIVSDGRRMFYEQGKDETGYYRRYTCQKCKIPKGNNNGR